MSSRYLTLGATILDRQAPVAFSYRPQETKVYEEARAITPFVKAMRCPISQ